MFGLTRRRRKPSAAARFAGIGRVAIVALVLLSALSWLAFGDNQQKIIPTDSPVYPALTSLYLETGLAPPSAATPYTVNELELALDRIDRAALSDAGKHTYDYLRGFTTHKSVYREGDAFQFNTDPTLTVAGYAQTDPSAQLASSEKTWTQRPDLFTLPLEVWLWDDFYAYTELYLQQDPFVAQLPAGTPLGKTGPDGYDSPTNIPTSVTQVYFSFPERAFMSYGGDHWNLDFGRDKLNWGNGVFGNLLLSDNPDYYDFIRFTTYWSNFKFTAAYIDLPPYFNGDPGSTKLQVTTQTTNKGDHFTIEPTKLFLNHRLEFRILDRATLALSEGMILAGVDPTLSEWNPLDIFHNWNVWEVANDIADAELSVNPFKWLTLYGQFATNQFGAPVEIYKSAANTPNAFAYVAGLQTSYPIGPGYLAFAGQWTKTDPWFSIGGDPDYGDEPWLTFDMTRRYLSNFLNSDPLVPSPTGWLYGPDSLVWNASLEYRVYGKWEAGLSLRIQQQGDNTVKTLHEYGADAVALVTPSGSNPIDTQVVHTYGTWDIGRYFGIDFGVGGDVAFIGVQNAQHQHGVDTFNVQLTGSVTATF